MIFPGGGDDGYTVLHCGGGVNAAGWAVAGASGAGASAYRSGSHYLLTSRIAVNPFPLTRNLRPEIGNPFILNFVEG